ncbi:LYAM3-like protein [Mya arenaria]|uniref:LYAM3-like protein n=1 Tax=Mya arenaria TaxID=6604 RepID=A0ABY7E9H8_MYAAR|nr:LYAM3-like protein [Mya arenaria]
MYTVYCKGHLFSMNISYGVSPFYFVDCGKNISVENAENITFHTLTLYQDNATVTCMQGYRLKGKNHNNLTSEVIRCVDSGLWTSPSGCEKKDCRDPPISGHSSRKYNSTAYESEAIFQCESGYHTEHNTTITCTSSGHWDMHAPNCTEPVMLDFEKAPEVCAHGDNEILDPINIPNGRFPYLGKYFDVFRPNLNGFLALNYPPLYERYGAENSTLWEKYVDNHIVIAPLWTNIDTRNITGAGLCVHVLSNKTSDAKDMKQIEDLVQQYTNRSDFSVDVAIALTWRNATIHSPYMPGYELIKQQNLSMQAIVVTDGLYTYLLFNYNQEQFSIKPDNYTPVAAGYTYPGNFSGKILADRSNFTNLKNGSNVSPAVKGRWLHNVTYITDDMWDEVRCRKFHENQTLKEWTRQQLKNSYPCPCYEQDMKEDYAFKQNDSLWSNRDQYTHCYESWFFNSHDIKQRCCFRFGELRKEYPFAIGAEFNNPNNSILEAGFRQCCSAVNSQRYCHLYYDVNPPDDCSSWSPDDEGVFDS